MPKTWKQILDDTAGIPDTTELTIGGETVTVGQLRTHNTETQGATLATLTQREQQIKERETNTETARENLANIVAAMSERTGLSFEQIIKGDTPAAIAAADAIRRQAATTGITVNNGEIDWANDPIYAPIDKRYAPLVQTTQQLQAALRAGLTVQQNDRTELKYMRYRMDHPEAKDLKYDDALRMAIEKKYVDEVGYPDVLRAMDDLAAPGRTSTREADLIKQAEERGATKARAELMGGIGAPAGGGAAGMEFFKAPDKNTATKSISEMLDTGFKDPEMFPGTVQ